MGAGSAASDMSGTFSDGSSLPRRCALLFFDENEAQISDRPTCTNSRLSPVSTSITHSENQHKRLFNHLQATISNFVCRLFVM